MNKQEKEGWTCAHAAADQGHLAVLEYLKKRHADLTKKTNLGKTTLSLARAKNNREIIRFLTPFVKELVNNPKVNNTIETGLICFMS